VQLGEAEGYGLPSGHVQNTTAVFVLLAGWGRRSWVWLVVFVYIGLMALSRF
jgi:membrane-associated phospholipid phosphatase